MKNQETLILESAGKRIVALEAERDTTKTLLSNLLAVIHRDGGQYEGKHGTEKAAKDAMTSHYALLGELEQAEDERDYYRAALEKVVKEYQNELVRVQLRGDGGGPQEAHWQKLQDDTHATLEQGKKLRGES